MVTVTLEYNNNNAVLNGILDAVANMPDVKIMRTILPNKDNLNYDKIGKLKLEQDDLIAQGKMQKPAMIVGFTAEERKMFDNGIPMETVFDRITEQCTV
jgi:hypothetical protein